ncbi:MAG: hypothetical protein HYS38_02010 [Acidobacteria bacterium]|nr:hypothetical protein [Acidobacteriota bacterium]
MAMSDISSRLLPDDVLSAILTIAKQELGKKTEERFSFRGHDSKLQEIFYKLSEEIDSPLVKEFVFSDTGPTPYSPILNESVSRLQLSGLLGRENPDYDVLVLRPAADTYFREVLERRFTNEEKEQLKKIAKRFLLLIERP